MSKKKKTVKTAGSSSANGTSSASVTVSHSSTATAASASAGQPSAAEPTRATTLHTSSPPEVTTATSQNSVTPALQQECMEVEESGLTPLSIQDPSEAIPEQEMAQAQIELSGRTRRMMSQAYKLDLDEPDEVYPIEKIYSPYVNKSFFHLSGALIRIFNQDIPGVPEEIGVMRLTVARPDNIPALLYREKGKLKAWAIGQLKGSLHESGHNTVDDKRFTVEEFTCRFSVSSLSEYGRRVLGTTDPGLWVLHAPLLIEPVVIQRYEDGSEDKFLLIKMFVNLVKPEKRVRKLPGGWVPAGSVSDSEVEKRKAPQKHFDNRKQPYDKRPRQEFDKRPKQEMSKAGIKQVIVETIKEVGANAYPALPASQSQGSVFSWPENDIPNISKKL